MERNSQNSCIFNCKKDPRNTLRLDFSDLMPLFVHQSRTKCPCTIVSVFYISISDNLLYNNHFNFLGDNIISYNYHSIGLQDITTQNQQTKLIIFCKVCLVILLIILYFMLCISCFLIDHSTL